MIAYQSDQMRKTRDKKHLIHKIQVFVLDFTFKPQWTTEQLILSSYLRLSLMSALVPSGFLHACYISRLSHPPLFDHPNNIRWTAQVTKLFINQSSPISCHFLPLILTICFLQVDHLHWQVFSRLTIPDNKLSSSNLPFKCQYNNTDVLREGSTGLLHSLPSPLLNDS
jgi:hypothetical protein